jgi:hypothetical protein
MMHADSTTLPILAGGTPFEKPEKLFAAIDDFSRALMPLSCLTKPSIQPPDSLNKLSTDAPMP